jgi:hypothetical protein
MNNRLWNLISIIGSVSSIFALLLVLIESNTTNPQFAVWRIGLALIGILFAGGVIVFAFDLVKEIWEIPIDSFRKKVVKSLISISFSLLCIVISLDAVFAAIYWRLWMVVSLVYFIFTGKSF